MKKTIIILFYSDDELDIQTLATPKPIDGLVVHPPFYQNGLIRVNVSWNFPPRMFFKVA